MADRLPSMLMSQRIAFGFLVAVVLIASGFVISLYSYHQHGQDIERVRHTYEVINSLDRTLSLTTDSQAGVRGFVVTGDSAFLTIHQAAILSLPGQLNRLRSLMSDNKVQIQRVAKLGELIGSKLTVAQLRIPSLIREDNRRMDAIRQHIAIMTDTERSLMEVRNRQASRSFRNTLILILGLSLLTFVALVISYRQLRQELVRRQETEDQLRGYELRLREQIRQLEASNEELERFAFVASHDLQEPLRKIQSFATLVTNRYDAMFSVESQSFMDKIVHSAERMSTLIKDLLNFSRMSSNREDFKLVSLSSIVQRILDDQELRIKGLNVRVEVGPLPTIEGVPSQLEHLFANLISNALKFLRPDALPLLRIQAKPIDGRAYAELIADRRYVEITVEDNGIGFDEKYLDHIFEVFQRLHGKSEFEGTGIGLAICKRVVVYHQGFITAHSQPNHGTTFVVVLPESQLTTDYGRSNSTETYSYSAG